MITLLACPFCGSTTAPETYSHHVDPDGEPLSHTSYSVICNFNRSGCGSQCGKELSKSASIKTWNRRSLDGEAVKEVCAKVCEHEQDRTADRTTAIFSAYWESGYASGCDDCARAIRALDLSKINAATQGTSDPVIVTEKLDCKIPGMSASVEITEGGMASIRKALGESAAPVQPQDGVGEPTRKAILEAFSHAIKEHSNTHCGVTLEGGKVKYWTEETVWMKAGDAAEIYALLLAARPKDEGLPESHPKE